MTLSEDVSRLIMSEEQHIDLKSLFDKTQEHVKAFAKFSEGPFIWLKETLEEVKNLANPKHGLLPQTPCMKQKRLGKLPLITENEEFTAATNELRYSNDTTPEEVFEEKLTSIKRASKRKASAKASEKITLSFVQEKIDPSKKSNKSKIVSISSICDLEKTENESNEKTLEQNVSTSAKIVSSSTATDRCLRPRVKKCIGKKSVSRSKAKKSVVKNVSVKKPKTPQEARMMLRSVPQKKLTSNKKLQSASPFQSVKDRVNEYTKTISKSSPVSEKTPLKSKPCAQTTEKTLPESYKKNELDAYNVNSNECVSRNPHYLEKSNDFIIQKNLAQSTPPGCANEKSHRLSKFSAKKGVKPSVNSLRLSSHLTLIKASRMSESQRRSSLIRHRIRISKEYLSHTNSLAVLSKKKFSTITVDESSSSSTSFYDSGKNTTQEEIDEKSDSEKSNSSSEERKASKHAKTVKRTIIDSDCQNEINAKMKKVEEKNCMLMAHLNEEKHLNEVTPPRNPETKERTCDAIKRSSPSHKEVKAGDNEVSVNNLKKAVIIMTEEDQEACRSFLENSSQPECNKVPDKPCETPLKSSRYKSLDCTSSDTDCDMESCNERTPMPCNKNLLLSSEKSSQERGIHNVFHFKTKEKMCHGTPSTWSAGKVYQNHIARLGLKTNNSTSKLPSSRAVSRIGSGNLITAVSTLVKPRQPSKEYSKELERQRLQEINRKMQYEEEILKKRNKLLEMKVQEQKKKREERMQKVAEARRKMEQEKEDMQKLRNQHFEEKMAKTEQERGERIREEMIKKQVWKKKKAEVDERRRQEEEARLAKFLEQEQNEKQRLIQAEKQKKECEKLKALLHTNNNNLQKVLTVNLGCISKADDHSKPLLMKTGLLLPSSSTLTPQPCSTLNSTYVSQDKENQCESYELTPLRPARSSCYNYDISDLKSDEESDDECAPKKPIPGWAQGIRLKEALIHQHYNPPDVDAIFEFFPPLDLELIFPVKRKRFLQRTSSAVWASPINISSHRN